MIYLFFCYRVLIISNVKQGKDVTSVLTELDNEKMNITCDQEYRLTGDSAVAFFSHFSCFKKNFLL